MKLVISLFLLLTTNVQIGLQMGGDNKCTRLSMDVLANCRNNSIRISKTKDEYKLQLCSNNHCTPKEERSKWIECKRIRDAYESLPEQHKSNG